MKGILFSSCIIIAVFLTACATPYSAAEAARLNVFTAKSGDVQERRHIITTSFNRNDGVSAVIQNMGWKPQTVLVEFINRDKTQTAFQRSTTVGRNETREVGPRELLPAGNYILRVTPEKGAPVVQNFVVYGQ